MRIIKLALEVGTIEEEKVSTFGRNEKRFRENLKMSMNDVAEAVGVSKGSVNMWENNDVIPRNAVLLKLAKLYGVSIDTLLGYDEKTPNNTNPKLNYIQRGLSELNDEELEKAEKMLKAVFEKAFEFEEEDDDI